MKYWIKVFAAVSMLGLTACQTPYKALGIGGGYSEVDIGHNQYLVSFRGNGYTSALAARNGAIRRAKELCEEKHMDFKIEQIDGAYQHSITSDSIITRPEASVTVTCTPLNKTTSEAYL